MKEINRLISAAAEKSYIVPGFNIFGHEDAVAVIKAAERANSPVLLMVNRDARAVLDIAHWGALLTSIAAQSSVPVGIHLDHCTNLDTIVRAMRHGFTSVMYDGSKLSLADNIANTCDIVEIAHPLGIAVEAELGAVPYDDLGESLSEMTSPWEAEMLCRETGVDWLAIAIGNIHRLTSRKVPVDFKALQAVQEACKKPLVIHGASGLLPEHIQRLKHTSVSKMNFGTVLRRVIGNALRSEINNRPDEFDRSKLMRRPSEMAEEKVYRIVSSLREDHPANTTEK